MTRKKVKLAYITNDSARKATYKKRKNGLMKKVSELTTLCDVPACAIIYSQYESQPEVWPSPLGVQRVLAQFKTMPEMEQSKKMVNQESFQRQRIAKANDQLKKQQKDNREKEMTRVMFQTLTGKPLHGLSMIDLNDIGWIIDQNLKEIANKLKSRKEELAQGASTSTKVPPADDHGMVGQNQNMHMKMIIQAAKPEMEGQSFELNNTDPVTRAAPWFMDMNPQEHIGFGAPADEMLPFSEQTHPSLWNNNSYNFP